MSVSLSQELLRINRKDSQKALGPSSTGDIPDKRFQELLHVEPVDEKPREKDFFSLVEEKEEEKMLDGPLCPQPNTLPPERENEKVERIDGIECSPSVVFSSIPVPTQNIASPIQPAALSPEIELFFEKMASCMIVMSASNEVETTLFLDNPTSIFFGTQITIREFSTAPKAFNVEITTFAPAMHLIESNKSDLLSAFQHGNFNFSIHRFETFLQSEDRPVLHRKESSNHDHQERKGGREK